LINIYPNHKLAIKLAIHILGGVATSCVILFWLSKQNDISTLHQLYHQKDYSQELIFYMKKLTVEHAEMLLFIKNNMSLLQVQK